MLSTVKTATTQHSQKHKASLSEQPSTERTIQSHTTVTYHISKNQGFAQESSPTYNSSTGRILPPTAYR